MAKRHEYKCKVCKQDKQRDELVVKRVSFHTMGEGSRTIRARVLGWVCKECVESDVDWLREPWSESPGHERNGK